VAQNSRRFLPEVLAATRASRRLPFNRVLQEIAHLLEPAVYFPIFLLLMLTPLLAILQPDSLCAIWRHANNVLLGLAVVLGYTYYVPQSRLTGGKMSLMSFRRFLPIWLVYFLATIGISLHNTLAVLSGLAGRGGEFVRTPKRAGRIRLTESSYAFTGVDRTTLLEVGIWVYLLACLLYAWPRGMISAMWPGLLGYTFSLAASFSYAVGQWWQRSKQATRRGAAEIPETD
jgi:hypothetical protein